MNWSARCKKGIWLSLIAISTATVYANIATAQGSKQTKKTVFSTDEIKPLKIGDKAPKYTFSTVLNPRDEKVSLSEYSGKLIIIDMWSTWCTSCIAGFPKMEELQAKFGNKLQVILANTYPRDSKDKIISTLENLKKRTGFFPSLPISIFDPILSGYFPHSGVPHIIWISPGSKIIGITLPSEVTEKNIRAVLNRDSVKLRMKNDFPNYTQDQPLYVDGNGGNGSDYLFRSILTGFKAELGSFMGTTPDTDGKITRFYIINYPLLTLIQVAYHGTVNFERNKILIETKDSSKIIVTGDDEIDNKNNYCYEISTPPITYDGMLEHIRNDISRMFQIVVKSEMRTTDCYILKANKNITKAYTKGAPSKSDLERTTLKKYISNKPVSLLVTSLNTILTKPIIDETGIKTNIDIELPFDYYSFDFEKMKHYLELKGFDLLQDKRSINVAVITDK